MAVFIVLAIFATTALVAPAPAATAAVPPATGNNAVITVKVGSDRTGASAVSNLAGVQLGLYTTQGGTTPVGGFGTCTSDADGDCSFIVPATQTGGANRDSQFWVKQISAPTGYFTNPTLAVGTTPAAQSYSFQTGVQLRNGQTYRSTIDFMISTGNTSDIASGGIWQNSRVNPVLPAQCGLNAAIVADLSNSVTAADLVNLKSAATTFVNALTGTPSTMSLFTFATASPAAGAANINRPAFTAVSTSTGAATVNGWVNSWTLPGGAAGGTNWDQAFAAVAGAPQIYDVVVVITDGNPTYYGNPTQGPGNRTRFREVENGIFSANAVKAQGSRILAMGVGAGVGGSPANLRAISGTTANSDYYQVTDYTAAGSALRALALGSCNGSLTVVKQVVPPGTPIGSTAGAQPAGGWTFGAATTTPGVTVAPASGVTSADTGALNYDLTFPGGTTDAPVTVTETPQAGYALNPIGGFNAVCTRIDTGAALAVTNTANGFTVGSNSGYPVSCTVYNRAPQPPATIQVTKNWIVDGVAYANGSQPDELTAALGLDGEPWEWATVQTGRSAGDVVAIDETTQISPASLCVVTSQRLTQSNGTTVDLALPYSATLAAGANTYQITNSVTCPARLTLVKTVLNGPAVATAWTLTSVAPAGALAGPTGTTGVTAPVTPLVTYLLNETAGDARYAQQVGGGAVAIPGSTISWFCSQVDPSTGVVIPGFSDGLNGGVTVPRGMAVRCEARNQTASLTLVKQVVNTNGGTALPGDWNLTADPGTNTVGLTPQTVQGSAVGVEIFVRPGQAYSLTESDGPAGYALESIQCVTSTVPTGPRELTSITLLVGETGVCTYTNIDQPARLTLVKTVSTDDGGTAVPTDWTLAASGPTAISGASGTAAVTDAPVAAGTYALSESGGPAGYAAGDWSCTGGTLTGSSLVLAVGEAATCTIDNDDQPASLTLVKTVTNDNGGTAVPTDWTLAASGPTAISGVTGTDAVTAASVSAGTYTLSESGGPAGYSAGDWSCTGGTLTGSSLVLAPGGAATCTIDNDDQPAQLTLVKIVEPAASGSGRVAADWTLTATGPTTTSGNGDPASPGGVADAVVNAGTYALSETGPAGFTAGGWGCTGATLTGSSVVIPTGGDVTCTITNTAVAPTLTLVKSVDNGDTGGSTPPTAWTLTAVNGDSTITGVTGSSDVTSAAAIVGTYALSETGPAGYEGSAWVCTGAESTTATTVTLIEGSAATCTITNVAIAPTLTLVKLVDNGLSGASALPTEWTLTAVNGDSTISGTSGSSDVTSAAATAGTYALSESGPEGYTASDWECVGGSSSTAESVTVAPGENVTCTITNTAIDPTLTLVKLVDNGDTGATTSPTAWTLTAEGTTTISGATGSAAVTLAVVAAGTYELSESGPTGYTASDWSCTGTAESTADTVTVVSGDAATCTITNTAVAPELTLVKLVSNEFGGTAEPTDWTLEAVGAVTIAGTTGADAVTDASVQVGLYDLSESGGPDGYDASSWVCEGATGTTDTTVTLSPGEAAICTITNSDRAATLTLVKIVRNLYAGTQPATAWTLSATGPTPISGVTGDITVTGAVVTAGPYELAETGPAGYDASGWTCTGAPVTGSTVAIALGTQAVCTIVNTDQAPPPPLPPTGGTIAPWGLPALALVLTGSLLVVLDRRRA
ncbi:hypothetical protein JOD63_003142 [Microbacterium terrae]|uniref:VWA domain-containing protein n=1 Tax=Microbacterium terrae TaxID=69369 RepID=UPI000696D5B3|nr:VWA domain-containing protein [Microbacterium terrae]MBP1079174.1 hypothetical protein [Microbacterium terrae]